MYKSFEEMPVWKSSMDLAVRIFDLSEKLPKTEDFGLTSQIRRSALSVSANIAESFGREHTLDKLNFYYHARGSLSETKSHLIYGNRIKYFSDDKLNELNDQIHSIWKDINRVIVALKKKIDKKR
ncbi:MAG: four helix bundle protein [Thermodesulfobacteriota bacterium]